MFVMVLFNIAYKIHCGNVKHSSCYLKIMFNKRISELQTNLVLASRFFKKWKVRFNLIKKMESEIQFNLLKLNLTFHFLKNREASANFFLTEESR